MPLECVVVAAGVAVILGVVAVVGDICVFHALDFDARIRCYCYHDY